jgi:Domain of unknown function (DUF4157)
MTPSPDSIHPRNAGAPSRVIQGFFPGGRPRIVQASPAPVGPFRPQSSAPVQDRPGFLPTPLVPVRPATGALQPSLRPGHPPKPILPTRVQPAAPRRPQAPQPLLPQQTTPSAAQPHAGDAFPLPANFTLKPRGSGQPLPELLQKKMETFFHTSFADVRVHVGHEAPSIGALAFTHGTDLYFAPCQYNPQSSQGQQLLGHELTHVVQQRAGRVRNPLGTDVAVVQDPALEAEAARMGLRASSAALPIQAKPAGVGSVVASLTGMVSRQTPVATNGAILPAQLLARGSVQRKMGPILPVTRSASGGTVRGTSSPGPKKFPLAPTQSGPADVTYRPTGGLGTSRVLQAVWHAKNKWKESGGDALKRILSIIGRYPLFFALPIKSGGIDICYFDAIRLGSTWISREQQFRDDNSNIFHITVSIDAFHVTSDPAEKDQAYDAQIVVEIDNFHLTVRPRAKAEEFQTGNALDKKNLVHLASGQKKLTVAKKAYKKEFTDKKVNKGKHLTWEALDREAKISAASGLAPWAEPPKATWVLSKEEAAALSVYSEVQAESVHSSSVGTGKLSSGDKSNTESAAQALNIDVDTYYDIPGALQLFKEALSRRLTTQLFELPVKGDSSNMMLIYVTNADVQGK